MMIAYDIVQELWRNGLLNEPSDEQAERAEKIVASMLRTIPPAPADAPISSQDLAECLMSPTIGKIHPDTWRAMVKDIAAAIRAAKESTPAPDSAYTVTVVNPNAPPIVRSSQCFKGQHVDCPVPELVCYCPCHVLEVQK